MKDRSSVIIFIDDQKQPLASYTAPVNFDLDTRKLVDGEHVMTIVSKDPTGKEGIKKVPFVVRNGPAITLEGIKENEVVDGVVPIMLNAYGKGDQKEFIIHGSETPRSVPAWLWILIIGFIAWSAHYFITSLQ
ncbi:MAG TPA: hypothetical protein VK369_14930 [Segetibacter sp.]|nr:hypothetical protein [Segetibacter sp.]